MLDWMMESILEGVLFQAGQLAFGLMLGLAFLALMLVWAAIYGIGYLVVRVMRVAWKGGA